MLEERESVVLREREREKERERRALIIIETTTWKRQKPSKLRNSSQFVKDRPRQRVRLCSCTLVNPQTSSRVTMLRACVFSTPACAARRRLTAAMPRMMMSTEASAEAAAAAESGVPPEDLEYGAPGQTIPVNIMKAGADPVTLPKSEYPEWLFELTKPEETEKELLQRKDEVTWKSGGAKYFRRKNRQRIKDNNMRGDAL